MKSPCWTWDRARNRKGYGQVRIRGKLKIAHRVAWEAFNGPIPKGVLVCHRCDNPSCVNPDHLFLGTNQDNIRDSVAKGRWKRHSPTTKLKESDVSEIRKSSEGRQVLARQFHVHPNTIDKIRAFTTWRKP